MNRYILDKSKLPDYLRQLDTQFTVRIPVSENGITQFQAFDNQVAPDFEKGTRTSIKSFLLPQRETMVEYSATSERSCVYPELLDTKTLLFGVKPCEAKAVKVNSQLLSPDSDDKKQDVLFKHRQQNTVLIGYGCNQPGISCFCRSVGGDPFGEIGLDAIMTDLGDRLLVTITGEQESAKALIEKSLMTEISDSDLESARQIRETACEILDQNPTIQVSKEDIHSLFSLALWEETAARCLNCGVCTYLCPTCTCFDMMDHYEGEKGYQSRCWDSCMFSLFTLHSLGHNPRPGKKERLRQRFLHKLRYFPEHHNGEISCVGCGRCVLYCPVNIDIREIADQVAANGGQHG